jgi:RES domain-containing protein
VTAAWRLVKQGREAGAFSGEGAKLYGGRWNQRGTTVVYVSDSLALAALELFVHLGRARSGLAFVAFRVEIPDEVRIEALSSDELPSNWRSEPPPDTTRQIGTDWAAAGSTVVLRVPSVLVPVENNYLANPQHPDFRLITISAPVPFSFDSRMWKDQAPGWT